jgi:hypothetical protein
MMGQVATIVKNHLRRDRALARATHHERDLLRRGGHFGVARKKRDSIDNDRG